MKFAITQKTLATALAAVSQAVATGKDKSPYDHIFLKTDSKCLLLTGFDGNVALKMAIIPASLQVDGACLLPAKTWADLVSKLDGEIAFTLANGTATMTTAHGQYNLPTLPVEDYPALPGVAQDGVEVSLTVAALLTGIDGALIAVSHDQSKQILQGIHLTSWGDDLEFVATDGHRLSVRLAEPSHLAQGLNCTVPGASLGLLKNILKGVDEPELTNVTVRVDDLQVRFQVEGVATLIVRLLDGQYPAHRRLLPATFERSFVVDRGKMVDALNRVDLFAQLGTRAHTVRIEGDSSSIAVSAEGGEIGRGHEVIDCQVTGDPMTWHVNAKYLVDGMKSLGGDRVEFLMNGPTTPVVLREPSEKGLDTEEAFYLLMPIQKQ
jgi:DNA polymerase-3 subunit beta